MALKASHLAAAGLVLGTIAIVIYLDNKTTVDAVNLSGLVILGFGLGAATMFVYGPDINRKIMAAL